MEHEGRDYPDYLMACVGGGSNAAGTIYHYLDDERVKIILAEAGGKGVETGLSAATIQLGRLGIIHGSKTLVMQDEDGQILEPYSVDDEALWAAFELTRLEGIIPALESAHALGALEKVKFQPSDIVVLTVSGRGDKDIDTYLKYKNNPEIF